MSNNYLLQNGLIYNNSVSSTTNNDNNNCNYIIKTPSISRAKISFSKEILIPLGIVKDNSSLEAIVLYLKEIRSLKFNEIANLLNRNQRTIWVTYANAKKKKVSFHLENTSQITLPLNIFTSRNMSILETIVFYLRTNYALTFNQISELLGKNYRTVWTVYKRALKKIGSRKHEL